MDGWRRGSVGEDTRYEDGVGVFSELLFFFRSVVGFHSVHSRLKTHNDSLRPTKHKFESTVTQTQRGGDTTMGTYMYGGME